MKEMAFIKIILGCKVQGAGKKPVNFIFDYKQINCKFDTFKMGV
jgi:hypothetical protein